MRFLERLLAALVTILLVILIFLLIQSSIAEKIQQGDLTEFISQKEKEQKNVSSETYDFSDQVNAYYQMLSENEKALYGQFYANAKDAVETFDANEEVYANDVETAFQAMYYDHPELYWVENTYTYQYDEKSGRVLSVTMAFNDTVHNQAAQQAFTDACEQIVSGAQQQGSDYEKEKYVHDALRNIGEYDLNASYSQSAYSLMVNHRTVCAGYARSFQYLMNRLGILTYYVVGTSEGQDHAWNMVMLDGEFYNVDLTWDDASSDTDPYYFFNVPDEEFNAYHARNGLSLYLPACTSNAYSHIEDAEFYQNYSFVLDE